VQPHLQSKKYTKILQALFLALYTTLFSKVNAFYIA